MEIFLVVRDMLTVCVSYYKYNTSMHKEEGLSMHVINYSYIKIMNYGAFKWILLKKNFHWDIREN